MKRFVLMLVVAAVVIGVLAFTLRAPAPSGVSAEVTALQHTEDAGGYARAVSPRTFVFPADHGPHPDYQTEWWYYTGNLDTTDGRHFGYQLTFFRRAITPTMGVRTSDWATNQIYFAHFALTDVGANRHMSAERFSRGAAGLAGASGVYDKSFKIVRRCACRPIRAFGVGSMSTERVVQNSDCTRRSCAIDDRSELAGWSMSHA